MDRPTCRTCAYFDPYPKVVEKGECKRRAPAPVLGLVVDFEPYWPTVHHEEWCGEHPDSPAYIRSLKADEPTKHPGFAAGSPMCVGEDGRWIYAGEDLKYGDPAFIGADGRVYRTPKSIDNEK